jgi:tetratricopeptide (TPR) repeat protein
MKKAFFSISHLLMLVGLLAAACQSKNRTVPFSAPLLEGLGSHTLDITTESELAEKFFNQGFKLTYAFNHGEAERSYREAIRQDPDCAMCYWGAAQVLGSNYNVAMPEEARQEALRLIKSAQDKAQQCQPWEKALIEATASRYRYDKTHEQAVLDQDYASALSAAHRQFPDKIDIAVLYAEALMILHPWDLYDKQGQPKAWTPEIIGLIERILDTAPDHPGANHLYIHAMEASDRPERAMSSADRLGQLMPGAGHMVHMPSHIYIRTGRYHEGSLVNEKAIEVDSLYLDACAAQGVYPLMLFPHNIHFLAATAALEGRGSTSIKAAWRVSAYTDTTMMREDGWKTLQHYWIIPYYVLVKFAQWDEILQLEKPDEDLLYPTAIWHYARGMAFAGKNQTAKAEEALSLLQGLAQKPELQEITIWDLNTAVDLVDIARRCLESEIYRKAGKPKEAIRLLREAVEIEDSLNYNEPPDWFFSVRHTLGAVLLDDEQFAEAEKVYQEDLQMFPENGWALHGLLLSLEKQQKWDAAAAIQERFKAAWQYADIALLSSEVEPVAYLESKDQDNYGVNYAGFGKITVCKGARKR